MYATARPSGPLTGEAAVPGDKSLSHRALMLAALAAGESQIAGLLEGEDVLATAHALRALGVGVTRDADGTWRVNGLGVGGFAEPDRVLDLGNAGTGARLLLGLLAGHPFTSFVTGDDSLRRRPMARVTRPLEQMGARITARSGGRLPLAITGGELLPIAYQSPIASAQVKSAVLLAGLHAAGTTTVVEPAASRDHTERMLAHMGATVTSEPQPGGGLRVSVEGQPELAPSRFVVPGDPSSAAFLIVAALLSEGSALRLTGIGVNPLRTGLLTTLREMGADITLANEREIAGEPLADLDVRASRLSAIEVPAVRAPSMIDEYPILAVAAAHATGRTVMRGLGELRVKESDRLAAVAAGLSACGVQVEVDGDVLAVTGGNRPPAGGARIDAHLDHRIAMSFLVLGAAARAPVTVDGVETIATSFPGFTALLGRLGASIDAPAEGAACGG